jgi:hypothetical protein
MKTRMLWILLVAFVATAAVAEEIRLPKRADVRSWIGASVVRDDGSAIVTVISQAPRRTDLVRIAPNGRTETLVIDGMAINSLREVGRRPNLFFVGASVDRGTSAAAYGHRLVEWTPQGLRTIWDSLALGDAIVSREPTVAVDDSGTQWAAAAQSGNSGFKVWLGDIGSHKPRRSFEISLTAAEVPEQFAADGFGVALVAKDVAAVLFRGNVYLLDESSSAIRAVLRSDRGGSDLLWERSSRMLWTNAYDEWASFSIDDVLAAPRQQKAFGPVERRTFTPGRGGDRGFPLHDGAFGRVTRDARGTVVELSRTPGSVPHSIVLGTGSAELSPNGRKLLVMPDGPESRTVTIREVP